jgi:hypothetical protein
MYLILLALEFNDLFLMSPITFLISRSKSIGFSQKWTHKSKFNNPSILHLEVLESNELAQCISKHEQQASKLLGSFKLAYKPNINYF